MKTTKTKLTLFLVYSVLAFAGTSCVQDDDPCVTADSSVEKSDSLDTDAKCSDGGTDPDDSTDPDDGADPVDPDPTDPADPTDPDPVDPPSNPNDGIHDPVSLNRPWNKDFTTIVIDAYEGNGIDWDLMATDQKVAGVIHRSSIGLRVDKKYKERKAIAKSRGYLWGAYHLGYRGNTIEQAELFLDLIDDEDDTLMILDLEDTNNSRFMSISEAVTFMEYVYEKTGRIPVVYANHSTTVKLNSLVKNNPLFQQSRLWYARFKSNVTDYPQGIWPNYFLWQFSSEINCSRTGTCLYNVPGTRFDMDVNVYYGTRADLEQNWY
jgi:GH25 family lysozyme M1 (1,4-beta-N-acetylmuramidase)